MDLAKLERDDPKQHAALLKSFIKEREAACKTGEKLKFSVSEFKLSWQSSQGIRGESEGELMWEGEYYEWATKTAKGGYLSMEEAKLNWQRWLSDENHPRDEGGPRNYLRLYVKTKDKIIDFQELSKQKELSKTEKLGKKTNEAVIASRLKMVTGEDGMKKHDFGDYDQMKEKSMRAFAGQGGLSDEGLWGQMWMESSLQFRQSSTKREKRRRVKVKLKKVVKLKKRVGKPKKRAKERLLKRSRGSMLKQRTEGQKEISWHQLTP